LSNLILVRAGPVHRTPLGCIIALNKCSSCKWLLRNVKYWFRWIWCWVGHSGRGVKLTTHLLVPKSRMRGAIPPSPPTQYVMAWCLV